MNIADIVKKYKIYEPTTKKGMLSADKSIGKNPEALAFVKEHKQEILAFLHEEKDRKNAEIKKAAAERTAWEVSIGLDKLKDAIRNYESQKAAYDRAWEKGEGIYPEYPNPDNIAELKEKYPIAAAYLKAESWSRNAHYVKASAGSKAMDRIRNGEDYVQAINDMELEFDTHSAKHLWD